MKQYRAEVIYNITMLTFILQVVSILSLSQAFLLRKLITDMGNSFPFRSDIEQNKQAIPPNNDKFCVNCKFFMNTSTEKFGRCKLFIKEKNTDLNYYLVTGIEYLEPTDYQFCSLVRSDKDKCGTPAIHYKEK